MIERRRSKVRRAVYSAKQKAEEKLVWNWRYLLFKAWSMRFGFASFAFTSAEILLPLWVDDMPRGVFAGLTLFTVAGGMLARIVKQKNVAE